MWQKFQNGCYEGWGEGYLIQIQGVQEKAPGLWDLRMSSQLEEGRWWKECFRKRKWHVQRQGEERMVPCRILRRWCRQPDGNRRGVRATEVSKAGDITQGYTAFSGVAGLSPEGNRESLEQLGKARQLGQGGGRQNSAMTAPAFPRGQEAVFHDGTQFVCSITSPHWAAPSPYWLSAAIQSHHPAWSHSKLTRKVTWTWP